MGKALYLGLISGTSADAIDLALLECGGNRPVLIASGEQPLPLALRSAIQQVVESSDGGSVDQMLTLDDAIAEAFAAAAHAFLAAQRIAPANLAACGSHGQTLRHQLGGMRNRTLQAGNPALLAAELGVPVVADFRRSDIAAGGEGAPLVPLFHACLFASDTQARAVLNLGGIANLTLLPPAGAISGFDSGPANALLDLWAQHHLQQPCDHDGAWARSGSLNAGLLERLLDDPYFAAAPPKSTGRTQFGWQWLRLRLGASVPPPADVQRTLTELTAISVARALQTQQPDTELMLVCGGGARNGFLLERLAAQLPEQQLASTAAYGMDPDIIEAAAFAWLAHRRLEGRPGNAPGATGARSAVPLGAIYLPSR